mgnify:CR=1 FL=1
MLGVTGTNGKTTTTYLVKHMLEDAGHKVGLIGTNQNLIGDEVIETERTTPESYELHALFARMRDAGCTHVIMEVSSHSLVLDRVHGIPFAVGAFTNLTQDHLDFHKTMEEYRKAKALLFSISKKGVINLDDAAAEKMLADAKCPCMTFSCGKPEAKMGINGYPTSDIVFENVRVHKSDLVGPLNKGYAVAMSTLDGGRLGVAAQSLGIAQGCLEEATNYAKERKQFGRPISYNQGISFMLADMAKIEAARCLIYNTAMAKDAGDKNASVMCSMAKYYASEMANRVAGKAIQIHGGYGFIKEYKVERLYRDARVMTLYEGTSQVQQMVISGKLLK